MTRLQQFKVSWRLLCLAIFGISSFFMCDAYNGSTKGYLSLNKRWEYKAYPIAFGITIRETVVDVTTINDREVYKILIDSPDRPQKSPITIYRYEDNGVIYESYNDEFYPIMDFNVDEGGMLDYHSISTGDYYEDYINVLSVENVEIKGIERRLITCDTPSYPYPAGMWLEGIGSLTSNFFMTSIPTNTYTPFIETLMKCYEGDECIYSHEDLFPESQVDEITTQNDLSSDIYDLMGRKVDKPQPGSLYIQNGKKIIFRN